MLPRMSPCHQSLALHVLLWRERKSSFNGWLRNVIFNPNANGTSGSTCLKVTFVPLNLWRVTSTPLSGYNQISPKKCVGGSASFNLAGVAWIHIDLSGLPINCFHVFPVPHVVLGLHSSSSHTNARFALLPAWLQIVNLIERGLYEINRVMCVLGAVISVRQVMLASNIYTHTHTRFLSL